MPPTFSLSISRRTLLLLGWILLAALPVIYIAFNAFTYSRNIVFWDEFDTALALILRIDEGADWKELKQRRRGPVKARCKPDSLTFRSVSIIVPPPWERPSPPYRERAVSG